MRTRLPHLKEAEEEEGHGEASLQTAQMNRLLLQDAAALMATPEGQGRRELGLEREWGHG